MRKMAIEKKEGQRRKEPHSLCLQWSWIGTKATKMDEDLPRKPFSKWESKMKRRN